VKRLDEISLFPLNTVLFPGGLLPLRIFEARYLDMISDCMRRQYGFGICAIQWFQRHGYRYRIESGTGSTPV